MSGLVIRRISPHEAAAVHAAAGLFDHPPIPAATADFLGRDGHHLLIAYRHGVPVGFVSGVEVAHPDKGTEMLLFELGVGGAHRRQGIGTALTEALLQLAVDVGATGMWVITEPPNAEALATYRKAGATGPEEAVILSWAIPRD